MNTLSSLKLNLYILIRKYNLIDKVNILFVLSTLFLVIISDYKIYDGFYTPMRGLNILFNGLFNINSSLNINTFIESTIHNDSVKLFPTLLEYIFSIPNNFWEPRISLLLGIISWIICYLLFIQIVFRIFKLSNYKRQIFSLILSFCFFSSLFFFTRFTTVFAIHRTLPILCSLIIYPLIFRNNKYHIISNFDFLKIIILCIVGQFSFASGIFIWPNTLFALILKRFLSTKTVSKTKIYYFISFFVLFMILYFYLFDKNHMIGLINNRFLETNASNFKITLDLYKNFLFIFTFGSSFLNSFINFRNNYYLISSSILWLFYIAFFVYIFKNKVNIFSKVDLFKIYPLIFQITSNFLVIASILISRGSPYMGHEARYFCESNIFSLSIICTVFYILLEIRQLKILRFFLTITVLISMSNLIAYLIYFKNYFLFPGFRVYTGDSQLVQCIKNEKNPSLIELDKKCKLGSHFQYFQNDKSLIHSSIKIKNKDKFAEQIFNTFGNKNHYIYSK